MKFNIISFHRVTEGRSPGQSKKEEVAFQQQLCARCSPSPSVAYDLSFKEDI